MEILNENKLKKLSYKPILLGFIIGAILSLMYLNDTVSIFHKIANCSIEGYMDDKYMTGCRGVPHGPFSAGALLLDIHKETSSNLKSAEVVITGNSRTAVSFPAPEFEDYFDKKGLDYYVLAAEGAGFRFKLEIFRKQTISPKILMINSEDFFSDTLSVTNQEVLNNPSKFSRLFTAFYWAQVIQKSVCYQDYWPQPLKNYYCKGTAVSQWRSLSKGTTGFSDRAKRKYGPFTVKYDNRIRNFKKYLTYAMRFKEGMPGFDQACKIIYLVPSPGAAPMVGQQLAEALDAQWVYAEPSLPMYTQDGSHMSMSESSRWAKAFIPEMNKAIDNCLKKDN